MSSADDEVRVLVNGAASTVARGTTVGQLLAQLGVAAARVAVEVNLSVIDRGRYEQQALAEGDQVEIVSFVGGGNG